MEENIRLGKFYLGKFNGKDMEENIQSGKFRAEEI